VSASEQKPLDKDRLVSAVQGDDDASYELNLRPRYLREFIGQKKVKENPWITSFYMVRRDWARRRWPRSSPMKWA
jgi:hypothetical protein